MINRHGFTLIELMITVVILGVLVTMAVPQVNNIVQMQKLRSEARKIVSILREVQQNAVSTETTATITFSPGTDSYIINGDIRLLPQEIGYTRYDVAEPEGIFIVSFSSLGIPNQAFSLELTDGEERELYVKVTLSGRTSISSTP